MIGTLGDGAAMGPGNANLGGGAVLGTGDGTLGGGEVIGAIVGRDVASIFCKVLMSCNC